MRAIQRTSLLAIVLSAAAFVGCSSGELGTKDEDVADPSAKNDGGSLRPGFESLVLGAYGEAPPDSTNALLADATKRTKAASLGHRIFFDTRFSGALLDSDHRPEFGGLGSPGETGKLACASCHVPADGFVDTRSTRGALSLGAAWTPRKSIALVDVAYRGASLLMWDGRHDALWNQVFTPFEKHLELNTGRLFVAQQIAKDPTYAAGYAEIFGALPPLTDPAQYPQLARGGCLADPSGKAIDCHGKPGDGAEYDALSAEKKDAVTRVVVNAGKAIQAYEQNLKCGTSRFDAWASGKDSALNDAEKRGAALFAGKGACVSCHQGKFLTDNSFHNIGLAPGGPQLLFMDPDDQGAAGATTARKADDVNTSSKYSDDRSTQRGAQDLSAALGSFKTPSLRCLSKRRSFFHTGQARTLADVVALKSKGGETSGFFGKNELRPLNLTESEQGDLVAFLLSLDGVEGGTDPKWMSAP